MQLIQDRMKSHKCRYIDGLRIICFASPNADVQVLDTTVVQMVISIWRRVRVPLQDANIPQIHKHLLNQSMFILNTILLIAQLLDFEYPLIHAIHQHVRALSRWQVIQAINQVFFVEYGFDGNYEDYYNPYNSLLDKVVIQRKGNSFQIHIQIKSVGTPLSLSALFVTVSEYAGLEGVYMMALPGHVYVGAELRLSHSPTYDHDMNPFPGMMEHCYQSRVDASEATCVVFADMYQKGLILHPQRPIEATSFPFTDIADRRYIRFSSLSTIWIRSLRNLMNIELSMNYFETRELQLIRYSVMKQVDFVMHLSLNQNN